MGLAKPEKYYTPEEYLAMERRSETRHEYFDGGIYPSENQIHSMAGESLSHSQICINLAGEARTKLKETECQALSPNMKVRAENKGMFAYPDLTVVCGEPVFHDRQKDVLLNPKVILKFYHLRPNAMTKQRNFFAIGKNYRA